MVLLFLEVSGCPLQSWAPALVGRSMVQGVESEHWGLPDLDDSFSLPRARCGALNAGLLNCKIGYR